MLLASGATRSAGTPLDVRFLTQHAFGAAYLYSVRHAPLLHDGSIVRNTNAVPSAAEEERIERPAERYGIAVGRFHGGPISVIDAAVLADPTHRVIIAVQNPKGNGGVQLSVMRYTSALPKSIPTRSLARMTIAGIGVGSSADEVYQRFGEPYAIAAVGSPSSRGASKHIFGKPSWFLKDLGDGVYYYAGPVPNRAQSCSRTFGIVMRLRRVSGILDSVEC